MSVVIKGMEMPKDCFGCDYSRTSVHNVDWCYLTEKDLPCECPLIELPPHGRLVDADRMIKDIKAQLHIVRMLGYKEPVMDEIANEIEKGFMQEIANAPTILEAEVEE